MPATATSKKAPAKGAAAAKGATTKGTQKPAAKTPAGAAKAPAGMPPAQGSLNLLPTYDALGVPDNVPLAELPPNVVLIGSEPDDDFVTSIKQFGVLQPILLLKNPDGSYTVAAGRRRAKAARLAGLTTIPAIVYPKGWVSHDVLTTIENAQRSENAAADLAAIEALTAQGASETQIREATGKSVAAIRQLLKLKALIPEMRAGFNEGRFTDRIAYKIIGLNAADQKKLVSTLAKNGKLVAKDVDLILAVSIPPKPAQAATPAPAPVPSPAPVAVAAPDGEEDTRPWYEQAMELVKKIQALTPLDKTDIVEISDELLKFVEYEAALASQGAAAAAIA